MPTNGCGYDARAHAAVSACAIDSIGDDADRKSARCHTARRRTLWCGDWLRAGIAGRSARSDRGRPAMVGRTSPMVSPTARAGAAFGLLLPIGHVATTRDRTLTDLPA